MATGPFVAQAPNGLWWKLREKSCASITIQVFDTVAVRSLEVL